MKNLKILSGIALAHLAGSVAAALPPTDVGDSFISYSYTSGLGGTSGTGLLYLGSDGTCRQVSASVTSFQGPGPLVPIYQGSNTGTYTYALNGTDPTQAALDVSMPSGNLLGFNIALTFTSATEGTMAYVTETVNPSFNFILGTFTLLLHSQNNFLANVSNRVTIRPSDTAITGFVIEGDGSRLVLVRGVGPTLVQFGVSPVSASPQVNLFAGTGTSAIGSGDPWDSGTNSTGGYDAQAMSWIFTMVGAFPLQANSKDVTYFGLLSPGVYTAQTFDPTTPANGGSVLTEVYILPYSG
jgi:hypothetical protein